MQPDGTSSVLKAHIRKHALLLACPSFLVSAVLYDMYWQRGDRHSVFSSETPLHKRNNYVWWHTANH